MQVADYRDPAKLATWLNHISHLYRPARRHHAHAPGAWHAYRDRGFLYLRPQLCTPNTTSGSLNVRLERAASAEAVAQAVEVAELEKGRVSPGVYLSTVGPFRSYCTCVELLDLLVLTNLELPAQPGDADIPF